MDIFDLRASGRCTTKLLASGHDCYAITLDGLRKLKGSAMGQFGTSYLTINVATESGRAVAWINERQPHGLYRRIYQTNGTHDTIRGRAKVRNTAERWAIRHARLAGAAGLSLEVES